MRWKVEISFGLAFSIAAGFGCAKGGSGAVAETLPEVSAAAISSVSPGDGALGVSRGAVVRAAFTEPMDPSSLSASSFTLTELRQFHGQVAGSVSYDPGTLSVTLSPSGRLSSGTAFRADLGDGIRDASGRTFPPFSWTFTTLDDEPPAVEGVHPACGTVNLATQSVFCVDFSEPVQASTVTTASFVLETPGRIGIIGQGSSWVPVPGQLSLGEDRMSACFVTDRGLRGDRTYRLRLTKNIQDDAGLALEPFLCEFRSLDPNPPRIVSVSPAPGATSVLVRSVVQANFSERLSGPLIGPSSLTLVDSLGNPVAGSLSLNPQGTIVTFTPASNLAYGSSFTATVDGDVQDLAGNPLGADFVWSFQTADPWSPPVFLETDDANTATDVKLAVDTENQRAYAVWIQKGASDAKRRLYSNVYVHGTGWTGVLPVSQEPSSSFTDVTSGEVDVDLDTGTAFAIWLVKDPNRGDAIAQAYAATLALGGPAWSDPAKLSTEFAAVATSVRIAADRSGLVPALAVYKQKGPAPEAFQNLHAATYDKVSQTWSAPILIGTNLAGAIGESATLSVDTNLKRVYVAWAEPSGGTDNVFVNTFSGGAWLGPVQMTSGNSAASDPRIAANSFQGKAVLAWLQKEVPPGPNDMTTNLYARDLDPATGIWSPQVPVTDDSAAASSPQLSPDAGTGHFVALWIQSTSLQSSTFRAGDGVSFWEVPKLVAGTSDVSFPSLYVEPSEGAALALWIQKDPNPPNMDTKKNVYFSQLRDLLTGTWDFPKLRASTDLTDADKPAVGAYAEGGALHTLGVWEEGNFLSPSKKDILGSVLVQ